MELLQNIGNIFGSIQYAEYVDQSAKPIEEIL